MDIGNASKWLSTFAVAALVTGGAAEAQAAEAKTPAASDGEIIVTAQRREERLQDVPMTVQAYTQKTIETRQITNISRLSTIAPSLQISGYSNQKPVLYIRGIGTRQLGPGADQSVGVFVDDFYMGDASALLGSLSDIQRIEVLKGPQGTLYGRNTIAGAISLVTQNPTVEPTAHIEGSIGNYDLISVRGSVSSALGSDEVAGRLSFYSIKRDGYMRNTRTGGTGMGLDQAGVRGKIQFKPTDSFTATVTADFNRDTSPGQFGKEQGPGTYLKATNLPNPPSDPRSLRAALNRDPTTDATNYGVNLRLQQDFDALSLISLTQLRKNRFHGVQDLDGAPLDTVTQDGRQHSTGFSQELRLTSTPGGIATLDGRLDWQIGLFYFHQRARAVDNILFGPDSFPAQLAHHSVANSVFSQLTAESYAAYAEATFRITEQLRVTGGLRYSHDKKDGSEGGSTDTPGVPAVVAPFTVPVRLRSHSLDPKVTVAYYFNPDVNIYATYSKGYKSGGFQYLATSPAFANRVYGPERVENYEAGIKSQLFDRHLTLNLSGFAARYKGLQLTRIIGTSVFTDNAAAVDLRGIEAEAHIVIPNGLSFDLGYVYLDNKFDSYNQCAGPGVPGCGIFDGTRLPRSPKHELNLGAQYVAKTGNDSDLTLRADWSYRSKFILDAGGFGGKLSNGTPVATFNPLFVESGYSVLDARITYRYKNMKASVWGTNLTDERYSNTISNFPSTVTPLGEIANELLRIWAPPRMYGVTLSYDF